MKSYSITTGPFTAKSWSGSYTVYLAKQSGWRQKPPYDRATSYVYEEYKRDYGEHVSADSRLWGWDSPPPSQGFADYEASVRNRAYKKWVNQLGDGSSFGATVTAERKETWGLFVEVTTRLLRAALAVKRMHFFEAASILGIPYRESKKLVRVGYRTEVRYDRRQRRKRKMRVPVYQKKTMMNWGGGRDYVKTLASGWLMYSYGVKPLASDCYNAIDFLTREEPHARYRGFGRGAQTYTQYRDGPYYDEVKCDLKVGCVGSVKATNLDLFLLNKMGLTNPLQWALEAIPFSFVVDWFSNLSDVVSAMNELGGLQIDNAVTSEKNKQVRRERTLSGGASQVTQYRFVRLLGLPDPKLVFQWERFSWQRGLNAISLLAGFLEKSPRK